MNLLNVSSVVLLANLATLVICVAATLRRPIASYKLISALAIGACVSSLRQVFTGRDDGLTLSMTTLLVLIVIWRIGTDGRVSRKRGHVGDNENCDHSN